MTQEDRERFLQASAWTIARKVEELEALYALNRELAGLGPPRELTPEAARLGLRRREELDLAGLIDRARRGG